MTENEERLLQKKYEIALNLYAKLCRKQVGYQKKTSSFDKEITAQAKEEIAKENGEDE